MPLYKPGLATPVTVSNGGTGDTSLTAYAVLCGGTTTTGAVQSIASVGTSGNVLTSNGASALPTFQPVTASTTAPTIQKFTSGSGTYTKPTSPAPLYIRVVMVGGGGAGGSTGVAGSDGGDGGNTTFGTTLLAANGGKGGGGPAISGNLGGGGGTVSLGSGPVGIAVVGTPGMFSVAAGGESGGGGASALGGAGIVNKDTTNNAATNSGSGGGGGSNAGTAGGGGAGGYVDAIITSPASTYSYAVGAAGVKSATGNNDGGAGGAGLIVVYEFYQ